MSDIIERMQHEQRIILEATRALEWFSKIKQKTGVKQIVADPLKSFGIGDVYGDTEAAFKFINGVLSDRKVMSDILTDAENKASSILETCKQNLRDLSNQL